MELLDPLTMNSMSELTSSNMSLHRHRVKAKRFGGDDERVCFSVGPPDSEGFRQTIVDDDIMSKLDSRERTYIDLTERRPSGLSLGPKV